MREFETGATRDTDTDKYDLEGFLSPRVLEAYAAYMHFNRLQEDGNVRDSDNWQKGIPSDAYIKSGFRHFFDLWKYHRGLRVSQHIIFICCAIMFNVMGYLDNYLKENEDSGELKDAVHVETERRQTRWMLKREQRRAEMLRPADNDIPLYGLSGTP
jgi:hypothetical protein